MKGLKESIASWRNAIGQEDEALLAHFSVRMGTLYAGLLQHFSTIAPCSFRNGCFFLLVACHLENVTSQKQIAVTTPLHL